MKSTAVLFAAAVVRLPTTLARTASPVAKVQELISEMQAKITAEGQESKQTFVEYQEWCEDQARTLAFSLKTEKKESKQLQATIEEESATQKVLTKKVDKLAGTIHDLEDELKGATEVRQKEAADFQAESKELSEVTSLLGKAILILKRELAKGPASMMQLSGASTLTQALAAIAQASMFSFADAERITSLMSRLEDESDELGAPAGAAYESHSTGLIAAIEGMLEKTQKQLSKIQIEEATALHNFEMLKQSLEDEIAVATRDMKEAKNALAASAEEKATAQGELEETTKEIEADTKSRTDLQAECMEKARDYEAASASREEELKALAEAKKVIAETTGGADKISYGFTQASLLQLDQRAMLPASVRVPLSVVRRLRELAGQQKSAALTQLASRISTAVTLSTELGNDPFAKVRGLINDLLTRLEKEAGEDASNEAYCKKEMGDSKEKKEEQVTKIEQLSTKIEQMSSRSAKLKEETVTLQKEMAAIAKSQKEMDTLRKKEHAIYVKNKAELEEGVEGIRVALKVLRDFYDKSDHAHDTSGSSSSVIAMVEVCQSDFSKSLSEAINTEEAAQASYEEQSSDNKKDTATKTEAVKLKGQEAADLDKAASDLSADRDGVQQRLDAILPYLRMLEEKCIAKPVSYEERKKGRDNELAGLKEALDILEGEEAFVQRSASRTLRGSRQHISAV